MANIKLITGAIEAWEAEHHLHNVEQWFGDGGGGTLAVNLTEIILTAGAGEAFSAGEQISDGTEVDGGVAWRMQDIHEILVTFVSAASKVYKLQFLCGTGVVGDATIATNVVGFFPASGKSAPIALITTRFPTDNKIWVKTACETDGATIRILVGIHTYTT